MKYPSTLPGNTQVHKVYLKELIRFDGYKKFGIIDESSWELDMRANEWLTEHCKENWGFYVEHYIVKVRPFSDVGKNEVYIGFESLDDAVMFKLSV